MRGTGYEVDRLSPSHLLGQARVDLQLLGPGLRELLLLALQHLDDAGLRAYEVALSFATTIFPRIEILHVNENEEGK